MPGPVPLQALPAEATAWIERLGLEALEHEGGLFRQTYLDEFSSAIMYLLADPDFSALHSLDGVEVYHWHAGSALQLLLLHPDGRVEEPVVGPDAAAGQLLQLVVPAGVMQGSSPLGSGGLSSGGLGSGALGSLEQRAWCLVGTTMAPAFNWEGFVLGDRRALCASHPAAAARIASLTR
jgi:predicted cupin superfamily sugar epimerase